MGRWVKMLLIKNRLYEFVRKMTVSNNKEVDEAKIREKNYVIFILVCYSND